MKPIARHENLVIEETEEGLVIYDLDRHRAHTLNMSASIIFKACDGTREVSDLASLLSAELDLPYDEQLVQLALQEIEAAHLLHATTRTTSVHVTRRDVLRRVRATTALSAVAIPVISSIAVAPPVSAMSSLCHPCPATIEQICADCGFGCPSVTATGDVVFYTDAACTTASSTLQLASLCGGSLPCGNNACSSTVYYSCT